MSVHNGTLIKAFDKDIKLLKENPKKFWQGITAIGDEAFLGRRDLHEIVIPEGVTIIGDSAFYNCEFLKKVKLPKSLKIIKKYAFSYTGITEITIPQGVKIANAAFCGCIEMKKVKLPKTLEKIGSWTFYACENLVDCKIPESVTKIGDSAFSGCKKFPHPDLGEKVKVGKSVFEKCLSKTTEIKMVKEEEKKDRRNVRRNASLEECESGLF